MNFDNMFNSNMQMSPLASMPNNQANNFYESSDFWSPFSLQLFAPYDTNNNYLNTKQNYKASSFQYSSSSYYHTKTTGSTNYSTSNASFKHNIKSVTASSQANHMYTSISIADYLPPNTWSACDILEENIIDSKNKQIGLSKLPKRSTQIDMSDVMRNAEIQKASGGRSKLCTFCKTNGECKTIYMSHSLKDSSDNVTCPILLNYSCPECGAAGSRSHTKKYCPILQKRLRMEMLKKMENKEN